VNEAPLITSANNTTFTSGVFSDFTVTTSGYPSPSLSFEGTLPVGITFTDNDDGTASISGTTTQEGTFNITIYAINAILPDAQQAFTIEVTPSLIAPVITSPDTTTFTVGLPGSFTVTASGYPSPTFSHTGSLPDGVTLTSAGLLSGTPTEGSGGEYIITITATNGVDPDDTQTFTLVVNEAPVITSLDSTTFTVGLPGSFTVTATGYPSPTFSYTGSLPDGVTLTSAGLLSGTAAQGTGGLYIITITASNGVEPDDTQTFTLTINEAPEITSAESTTFAFGELGSFTITTSGFPTPFIWTDDSLPTWLTLVDQGDGTAILSGTPPDEGGVDYILFKAANGVTPDAEQSFTLTWEGKPNYLIFLPLILR
jgi:hypothetical protein